MFGKSFNDISNAITNRLIDFNDEFERTGKVVDSLKNTDGIWKRLYGNKNNLDWIKNSSGEIVSADNIDSFMPKMNDEWYSSTLSKLVDIDTEVKAGTTTWQKYFSNLEDGQKWQIDFVQNTDLQKASLDDVKIAQDNARKAAIAHNTALKQQTLGAKAANVAMKGLSIAGNVLLSMLVSLVVTKVVEWIDNVVHKTERMQEALENSVDEFNTATDELKTLEEELKTTTERLEELQKLADNGTISIAEESELDTLKKTNKELARKVALKQQEQAQEARDVLKDSKENTDTKVESDFIMDFSRVKTGSGSAAKVTPYQELIAGIESYKKELEWAEANPDKYESGAYVYNEKHLNNTKDRIEEMYALISPTINAYEDLINAGIELEGEDKTRYEQLKKSQDAYLAYIYTLNGTKEAFAGLNEEQQKTVLLNRLIKQGLSEDYAKAIVNSINPEDLDKYWDANFKFIPPDPNDYDSAEEYGKAYAEAWAKSVEDNVQGSTFDNKTEVSIGDLKSASDGLKTLGTAFKEMSDDGYVSLDTLEDIKSTFADSVDDIDSYVDRLMKAKAGSKEFSSALTDLTYGYINQKMSTEQLANADEAYIATLLKEVGVSNSVQVAQHIIAVAKEKLRLETEGVSLATADEINDLMNEEGATNATKQAIIELARQKTELNMTKLDFSSDLTELDKIIQKLGVGTKAYATFEKIKALQNRVGPLTQEEQNMVDDFFGGNFDFEWAPSIITGYVPKTYYTNTDSKNSSSSAPDKPNFKDYETNDEYSDLWNELLEDKQNEIEKFDTEYDALNTKLENALLKGNSEEANVIRQWMNENRDNKRKLLEEHTNMMRADLANIMKDVYDVAPELSGKAIDEISSADIEIVRQRINQGILDAKNAIIAEENAWEQESYNIKSVNKNKETEAYKTAEAAHNERTKALERDQKSAELLLDKYDSLIGTAQKYNETIGENSATWWDDENQKIEERNTLLNDLLSDIEKHTDKTKESIEKKIESKEKEIKKEEAMLSVMQKEVDLSNKLYDAQHEADKAIATSRISYSYLDEDLYDDIYNEEDYKRVSNKITEVQAELSEDTARFLSEVEDAYAQDKLYLVESITAEYERQCDLKERELEILQAEIDLQKKQEQLNNVLAEKNVRLLKDGEWIWTHDVDKARQATEELADAQYQMETLERQQEQQYMLNEQQMRIDSLNVEIGAFENEITLVDKATENLRKSVENITEPLDSIKSLADEFATNGIGQINEAVNDLLDAFSKVTDKEYNKLSTGDSVAYKGKTYYEGTLGYNLVSSKKSNSSISSSTYIPPWKKVLQGYSSGTKHAKKGLSWINEIRDEGLITNDGTFVPMANFSGGETVFNHLQMENLWELSKMSPPQFDVKLPTMPDIVARTQTIDQSIHIDKVDVNQPADFNGFVKELNTKMRMIQPITNKR